jgi:sugar phosphate isomerase/epimerase
LISNCNARRGSDPFSTLKGSDPPKAGGIDITIIGLKCGLCEHQVTDRLRYGPDIIELHLTDQDMYQPNRIMDTIQLLKNQGIQVYLHHPIKRKGTYLDIASPDPAMRNWYNWSCAVLAGICEQEHVPCIVHAHYDMSCCRNHRDPLLRQEVRRRIEETIENCGNHFLWENSTRGVFSHENPYLYTEIVEPLQLPLCVDISHSFISLKDNTKLRAIVKKMVPYTKYYHVVDSMGIKHDSLPLGCGKIDWNVMSPFLAGKNYIFEIGLPDVNDCTPMVESADYLKKVMEEHLYSTR